MCALAANWQTFTVAQTAIAAEIHQALDVELHVAPQVAFDHVVAVDDFANLEHLGVGQLGDAALRRQINLAHDILSGLVPDPMDVLERDDHAFVGRQIDTRDTSHLASPIDRQRGTRRISKSLEGDSAKRNTTPVPALLGPGIASNS